jgi:hypothetical protein
VLSGAPAVAQEVVTPPIEFGVVASGLLPVSFEGGAIGLAAGGASVTYNIVRRIGIEAVGEIVGPNDSSGLYGLYQLQGRFPLRTSQDGGGTLFVTAGVGGSFYTQHRPESRRERPDGSIIVTPAFRRSELYSPRLLSAGISHRRVLNSHVSLILAAQALFGQGGIAPRATVGVSFGVRRYR